MHRTLFRLCMRKSITNVSAAGKQQEEKRGHTDVTIVMKLLQTAWAVAAFKLKKRKAFPMRKLSLPAHERASSFDNFLIYVQLVIGYYCIYLFRVYLLPHFLFFAFISCIFAFYIVSCLHNFLYC